MIYPGLGFDKGPMMGSGGDGWVIFFKNKICRGSSIKARISQYIFCWNGGMLSVRETITEWKSEMISIQWNYKLEMNNPIAFILICGDYWKGWLDYETIR